MELAQIFDFLTQTTMGQPVWLWGSFLTVIFTLLFFDLGVFNRKDHVIDLKESLRMSAVYVSMGLLFGLWVLFREGRDSGLDYYTVYLIELSLSVDNLFVISIIFASFHIPRQYRHRVLIWGIIGAIVMRGTMIALGSALVNSYAWVLLIFAAILIYTGIKLMFMHTDESEDYTQKGYVRFLARHMRVLDTVQGNKFFVKRPAPHDPSKLVLYATPLFLALCVVELTDVMFAFDSVPAAFAITTDPYIVYTANIFAILGLRAMFFAMEHVIHRFVYLKYSLSFVLVFIGIKVFYSHIFEQKIEPSISLSITLGVLALGVIVSLIKTKNDPPPPVQIEPEDSDAAREARQTAE